VTDLRQDDVGLLFDRTIVSQLGEIDAVVLDVVAACRGAGCDDRACRFTIPLVVTEVLTNAIESGNGNDPHRRVRVCVRSSPQALVLEVLDEGHGFDLAARSGQPDAADWTSAERGRGLFLVSRLTERIEALRTPAGGVVRVTLRST
jgi:anti-sigma regulatory factor (Ser/Thr protein kinase)